MFSKVHKQNVFVDGYFMTYFFLIFEIVLIYFSERKHKQEEWKAEAETGSSLSRKPDAGSDPRTWGS